MGSNMKVFILGIDGMSSQILHKISEQVRYTHIREFVETGKIRSIESVVPPMSAPAWISIFTGMHPNEHKVYDFYDINSLRKGEVKINSKIFSKWLWHKMLWSKASLLGYKCVVVGVPVIFPARWIRGTFLCGDLMIPELTDKVVWPREKYSQLLQMGYKEAWNKELHVVTMLQLASLSPRLSLKKTLVKLLLEVELRRFRFFTREYETQEDANVIIYVSELFDRIAHYFLDIRSWGESLRIMEPYIRYLDKIFGWYLDKFSENSKSVIYLISDHGMSTIHKIFLINSWLMNHGYLKLKLTPSSIHKLQVKLKFLKAISATGSIFYKGTNKKNSTEDTFAKAAFSFPALWKIICKLREIKVDRNPKGDIRNIDLENSIAYAPTYTSQAILVKRGAVNDLVKELETLKDVIFDELIIKEETESEEVPEIIFRMRPGVGLSTLLVKSHNYVMDRERISIKVADHTSKAVFGCVGAENRWIKNQEIRSITELYWNVMDLLKKY